MTGAITIPWGSRVLFLDDMRDRREAFGARLPGVDIVWAKTAQQGVDALYGRKAFSLVGEPSAYDAVFLDHDLSEEHYDSDTGEDDPTTGLHVAREVQRLWGRSGEVIVGRSTVVLPPVAAPVVVVHSMNPVGARRMMDAMHGIPFRTAIPFRTLLTLLRVVA